MPLFSGFWSATSDQDLDHTVVHATDTKDLPQIVIDESSSSGDPQEGILTQEKTSQIDAAAVPLPMSPLSPTPPAITKAPPKKRKKARSFTSSKVFILNSPTTKRINGKKTRMVVSDVSIHFPKIHIDKGVQEDMQERLVEVSNASELELEGYILAINSLSSFSLISMATSARVADFSLPLHPHKIISISFPPSSQNSRPRPHSQSSSISTSSAASISSQSRRNAQRKMAQQMITMTSLGSKARMFPFDGYSYRWIVEDGGRVLRRYASTEPIETPVDGELCARHSNIKRRGYAVLLVDPSRCDERVAIATLSVCLRKEEGLRGLLAGLIR